MKTSLRKASVGDALDFFILKLYRESRCNRFISCDIDSNNCAFAFLISENNRVYTLHEIRLFLNNEEIRYNYLGVDKAREVKLFIIREISTKIQKYDAEKILSSALKHSGWYIREYFRGYPSCSQQDIQDILLGYQIKDGSRLYFPEKSFRHTICGDIKDILVKKDEREAIKKDMNESKRVSFGEKVICGETYQVYKIKSAIDGKLGLRYILSRESYIGKQLSREDFVIAVHRETFPFLDGSVERRVYFEKYVVPNGGAEV